MKIILFYNWENDKYSPFSNWYLESFNHQGVKYSSMEQYMMAQKALVFSDTVMHEFIMNTHDPEIIKGYGRKVSNFNSYTWSLNKQSIIESGLHSKFTSSPDSYELLRDTGDAIIAEAAEDDLVWGIGLHHSHPDATDPSKWRGKNLIGKCIMNVRKELFNI